MSQEPKPILAHAPITPSASFISIDGLDADQIVLVEQLIRCLRGTGEGLDIAVARAVAEFDPAAAEARVRAITPLVREAEARGDAEAARELVTEQLELRRALNDRSRRG